MVTSITAHLTTPEEIRTAFGLPRSHAARTLGLAGYGLEVGPSADVVFLEAADARDALRRQPPRRCVVRGGHLVAESHLERRLGLTSIGDPR